MRKSVVAFLQRITKGSGKWLDNGSNESLKSQAESTSRIEALHIFGFIAFSYLIYGFIVIVPSSFWLTCMIVAQVFANIYPIMLQRYIRTRIYNILEHRELKRTSKIISQSDIPQNELTIDRGEIRSVIGEVLTSFPKTVPLAIRQSL